MKIISLVLFVGIFLITAAWGEQQYQVVEAPVTPEVEHTNRMNLKGVDDLFAPAHPDLPKAKALLIKLPTKEARDILEKTKELARTKTLMGSPYQIMEALAHVPSYNRQKVFRTATAFLRLGIFYSRRGRLENVGRIIRVVSLQAKNQITFPRFFEKMQQKTSRWDTVEQVAASLEQESLRNFTGVSAKG